LLAFETGIEKVLRDAICPPIDLGPRAVVIAVDQTRRVRQLVCDHFPDVGKVPVPHRCVRITRRPTPASPTGLGSWGGVGSVGCEVTTLDSIRSGRARRHVAATRNTVEEAVTWPR
jgi:hypothetical protein